MQLDPEAQSMDPKDLSNAPTYRVEATDHDIDKHQYLTGVRLAMVLGALTLVSFLVMLDMSILGTVSIIERVVVRD